MKLDVAPMFSAYASLSRFLEEWAYEHEVFCDLIVDIGTGTLGEARVIAYASEYGGYEFNTDWYEGGELELLGITPVEEIGEPKYKF